MKATQQYLRNYAEPAVQQLHNWPADCSFQYVLVVPAYDESPDFVQRMLAGALPEHRALAIIVVNRPDTMAHCPQNDRLIEVIESRQPLLWRSDDQSLSLRGDHHHALLLVDRHTNPVAAKQGVGLARKLGADLGTALIERGFINSPWIHSSDADAHLPSDYFSHSDKLEANCSAACYQFSHRDDGSEIGRATQYYQQHLRHYTEGLRRAGSPYAYYTIGSILAVHYQAYCKVRGFPRRAAGEDFYLLNKLAKQGVVAELPAEIQLQPRLSQRVPFGTGPATAKIVETLARGEAVCSYHPQIFIELQRWLQQAQQYIEASAGTRLDPAATDALQLPAATRAALQTLNIESCWRHLNQSADVKWQLRHFHDWFDAFRTLKFVHLLEANGLAPQPLAGVVRPK